jgi:hypothetical protein
MTSVTDELLCVPKNTEKEVFTLKASGKYFVVINSENDFHICPQEFDSPLKAANHGRSLKRKNNLSSAANTLKKSVAPVIRPKVRKKKELFTEAEVAAQTHLRFKEVWVVVNPEGKFVVEAIKNKTLVKYSADKNIAQVFKTYEDALYTLTTLDMVVRKGHQLRRYFEKAE